jgi:hypothetical protein
MRRFLARASSTAALLLLTAMSNAVAQSGADKDSLLGGFQPIIHARTYFWDSRSTGGEPSEAWALGGWAGFKTRWYGDLLQLGLVGYTSQKLYGPPDKGGSQLLGPDQAPINVLGQAFGALKYAGQTFTGYRQTIDQPWVNQDDTKMIPNLFEGYLLSGTATGVDYIAGYVTKIKIRDATAFQWMSSAAGSSGPQQGMILFGARVPFAEHAEIRIAEQYLTDTYNTAYVDGELPVANGVAGELRLGGQYANQQSVGSAGLGTFDSWMYGVTGIWKAESASVRLAWTQTGRGRETQSPFGTNPSYLHMMQVDFNDAGEKAWLIGGSLDFAGLGLPELHAVVEYGNGRGAIDPSSGAQLGSRNEIDVRMGYGFDKASRLKGLSFGIEGSWLNQAGAAAQGRELRVYANYEVVFDPP